MLNAPTMPVVLWEPPIKWTLKRRWAIFPLPLRGGLGRGAYQLRRNCCISSFVPSYFSLHEILLQEGEREPFALQFPISYFALRETTSVRSGRGPFFTRTYRFMIGDENPKRGCVLPVQCRRGWFSWSSAPSLSFVIVSASFFLFVKPTS